MGEWLIADVPLFKVHLQLWMLLVTGFMVLWFVNGLSIAVAEPLSPIFNSLRQAALSDR